MVHLLASQPKNQDPGTTHECVRNLQAMLCLGLHYDWDVRDALGYNNK